VSLPAPCKRMEFRPKTLKIPAHARAAECDWSAALLFLTIAFK
jgi:hypothetical protein